MSKAGVEHAERLLASPQVSMVIVRLTIPIGVNHDGPARRPGGGAAGLRHQEPGRRLLDADAAARGAGCGNGGPLAGPELAVARGPIMVGTPAKPNDPKVGRVLGGGKVKKDYPFTLVIKENRESYRTAKMLETVVNERFHQTEDGHQKGVATAKTPATWCSRSPTLYHQNQQRFFRVVQLLQMIDGPELRSRRRRRGRKELLDPATAGVAA